MDVWLWVMTTIIVLFGFFGLPYPYGKIGKKLKKSYKWTNGLYAIVVDKLYVKESILESFVYFIEEVENFVVLNSALSFTHMYRELVEKSNFSDMERKYIDERIEDIEVRYREIRDTHRVRRKGVFKQTVSDFKKLVESISKMAKDIKTAVKDKQINIASLGDEYLERYRFSSKEFNNFTRYFRSFLDKTSCYHGVEIEQYRLMQLLIPEELF